jgi:hypothetical protein
MSFHPKQLKRPAFLIVCAIVMGAAATVWAIVTDHTQTRIAHQPVAVHTDQMELVELVREGKRHEAFELAFEEGDEFFATDFNALDGGGGNVGTGQRYTRVPRADLKGAGEWFNHTPKRVTGPNAASCAECHNRPFEDGAGAPSANVHRDTFRTGLVSQFVERNTPHVFAIGAIQRLAEEMTDDLRGIQTRLQADTCRSGGTRTAALNSKGVNYGSLSATRTSPTADPCTVTFDTTGVRGVDFSPPPDNPTAPPDLVVRPFNWKGSVNFVRDFNRGAAHNEIGVQAVEIVGDDVDGDFDGIRNEATVGDMTALAVYMAAQPRPTTLLEMAALGLIEPLPAAQVRAINRGAVVFQQVGCAVCHRPTLTINRPIFSEPSTNAAFTDGPAFPAGQNPVERGIDIRWPVTFDLTRDQPDNIIEDEKGEIRFRLGSLRRDGSGRGIVELFGDLKRHDLGPRVADQVNEIAGDDVTPIPLDPRNRHTPSTFLTENLWGVGSTAPYMHDGRATTLVEAILSHSTSSPTDPSEARASRQAYLNRSNADKRALIAFLNNLVLFKMEEEEETGEQVVTFKPQGVKLIGLREGKAARKITKSVLPEE